ncbi:hypothetical protein RHS01_04614 [Rhizoctonia solani]|uniref:Uncharacterized protein n=1 Tax=Rhizoctonia solani TaxID=456999 RepID=A0A8H7IC27_9AGAM|nr:hypothetical protein RHS01_04614 [Rhizoctonia solani]
MRFSGTELSSEPAARSLVAKEHQRVVARLEDLDREHQSSLDTIHRLERIVQARNTELAQTEESIRTQALEAEQLRSHRRELERIKVQRDNALQAESQLRKQLEDAHKLRSESVNELMTETADKEVRIVQLSKACAQDLEDKEGLNVPFNRNNKSLNWSNPCPIENEQRSYSRRESTASSAELETPLPRAMTRKDYPDFAPSESTATASFYSVAATPLQTSSRTNIYGATAESLSPIRTLSNLAGVFLIPSPSIISADYVRDPSTLCFCFIPRGVHFATSETSRFEADDSDATIQQILAI